MFQRGYCSDLLNLIKGYDAMIFKFLGYVIKFCENNAPLLPSGPHMCTPHLCATGMLTLSLIATDSTRHEVFYEEHLLSHLVSCY